MLKISFTGQLHEIEQGLEILCKRLHICISPEGLPVKVQDGNAGLLVEGKNGSYKISYGGKVEFFRGLAILKDRIVRGEEAFSVQERPRFDTCGTMIDVSRNAVLTVKTAKDLFERMALMGLNMFMLYTEDTYEMEKYPWFGHLRGAYTKEELKEMDQYCQIFGIELIPCIETLSHLGCALRWAYASEMRDQPDILMVDEPKTYEFIEEMFKVCRECYTTKRIHIGLDETVGLGLGQYLLKNGYVPAYELFTRHMKKVAAIAEKYDFRPMMWSDMFFRMGEYQLDYDVRAEVPENAAQIVPENMDMVFWEYVKENPTDIRNILDKHDCFGGETIFAGGIWTWGRMIVNLEKTFITARSQLGACKEKGIKTVFATTWGGNYNIYGILPGLQMYAEQNYYDQVSDEHLTQMFRVCTGYELETFRALCLDDFSREELEQYKNNETGICCVNPAYQLLFNDILLGIMDQTLSGYDFKSHYGKRLELLESLEDQADMNSMFVCHKKMAEILTLKSDLGPRLTKAYEENNLTYMKVILGELKGLLKKYEEYHVLYGDIWHSIYKPFGWEAADTDLGSIESRIKWAIHRVEQYLDGRVNRLEELEAQRFYYNDGIKPLTEVASKKVFMKACCEY